MHVRVLIAICVLLVTTTALESTTSEASTTTSRPPPTSTIPAGYTYYPASKSYYKLHERRVSWYVGNTTCASEGAYVVVLNDAEEADIVARIVRDAVGNYSTWTGLRDNRPGGVMEWSTVHGEALSDVYNVWGEDEPENKPRMTCSGFNAEDKRLYNYPCDYKLYYLFTTCEISQ